MGARLYLSKNGLLGLANSKAYSKLRMATLLRTKANSIMRRSRWASHRSGTVDIRIPVLAIFESGCENFKLIG